MSQDQHSESRRRLIKAGLLGVAAVPLASLISTRRVQAAEDLPKLEESDPAAKALGYVHDASEASDNPAHAEGAQCAKCQLYTGDRNADWGTCSAFPGKLVNTKGWCTAFVSMG
ncbi:MAG TPA: high-potential iron-sulfur protein [Gammaproteobacteria bacterium]|nr:high-potential iron-sulfur protein [Gammaproteobacteria bacterium]